MKTIVFLVFFSVLAGCSSTPKIPTDTHSVCMMHATRDIVNARIAHAQIKRNMSKTEVCSVYAESKLPDSRVFWAQARLAQGAAGRDGRVAMPDTTQFTKSSPVYIQAYSNCMKDPNINAQWEPPAYTQLKKTLFAINTISVKNCPADFIYDFNAYKLAYTEAVQLSKNLSNLNLSSWAKIVNLKVPGNTEERLIVEIDEKLEKSFERMVQKFRDRTGWCPRVDMRAYYPCN